MIKQTDIHKYARRSLPVVENCVTAPDTGHLLFPSCGIRCLWKKNSLSYYPWMLSCTAVAVVVAAVVAAAASVGEVTSAVERIGTNARSRWSRTSLSWYAVDFCHSA